LKPRVTQEVSATKDSDTVKKTNKPKREEKTMQAAKRNKTVYRSTVFTAVLVSIAEN
jgi:hypothetical protein